MYLDLYQLQQLAIGSILHLIKDLFMYYVLQAGRLWILLKEHCIEFGVV